MGSEYTATFRTADTPFAAVLILERTSDGLTITTIRHSNTGELISRTDATANVPSWVFNAVAFAHNGNFVVLDIDILSNLLEP
ncbi:MAG: hypothetical protein LR015_10880 [Verrucomicrobia bacterium]|nr:hypothetical protein [Verrucomicrobiota bacterium]